MTVYFKAVRADGGSFHNPDFKWALQPGGITTHPNPAVRRVKGTSAADYLSVSTTSTDCTGFEWEPGMHLLLVEEVEETWVPEAAVFPSKVAGTVFRTIGERPNHEVFGPYGVEVVKIIDRAARLTAGEVQRLSAAYLAAGSAADWAAFSAAYSAARLAARLAARSAARSAADWAAFSAAYSAAYLAAGSAAYSAADSAAAWVVKDLITDEQFQTLTAPWYAVITEGATA